MPYPTPIEWTDATHNPIGGCSPHSPGYTRLRKHPLYAGTTTSPKGRPIFNGKMTAAPAGAAIWRWPLTWRGVPNGTRPVLGWGMPSTIFLGDMSDVAHHDRPLDDIVRTIAPALVTPHVYQILTKRSDRLRVLFTRRDFRQRLLDAAHKLVADVPDRFVDHSWPLPNIWLGVSAERQPEADGRRDDLLTLAVAGWTTFLSYEPALGLVDWTGWDFLAWLISGGESGRRGARPSHPDWHRAARDYCAAEGIPFFFKQWGGWRPLHDERNILEAAGNRNVTPDVAWPDGTIAWGTAEQHGGPGQSLVQLDKAEAGHLLDGVEHRAFPRVMRPAGIGAAA